MILVCFDENNTGFPALPQFPRVTLGGTTHDFKDNTCFHNRDEKARFRYKTIINSTLTDVVQLSVHGFTATHDVP